MKPHVFPNLLTVSAALLLAAAPAFAQEQKAPPPAAPEVKFDPKPVEPKLLTSYASIVEKVVPSVVQIATTKMTRPSSNPLLNDPMFRRFFGLPEPGEEDAAPDRDTKGKKRERKMPFGLGSGVLVTKEGHILTNNHVIDGADDILVTFGNDKHEHKATKIGTDPDTDLAVLKIDAKDHVPVTFADSDKLRVGDVVFAIGSPFGLTQSVTMGIVSSLGRSARLASYEDFIQTDASINMGNSGGALIDAEGRLAGINTAIFSRTGGNLGIGFAVPANLARGVMESLIKHGRVIRGFMGVIMQDLDEEDVKSFKLPGDHGVLITDVQEKSPADKAGLKSYDVITELNGQKVEGMRNLRLKVSSMPPGTKVNLKYVRNGEAKEAAIELGELPGAKRTAQAAPTQPDPDVLDGVTVSDVDDETRKKFALPESTKGVIITKVDPDSDSAAAGIEPGDLILDINREPITTSAQAIELSEQLKKEKSVLLRISKKGAVRIVKVKEKE